VSAQAVRLTRGRGASIVPISFTVTNSYSGVAGHTVGLVVSRSVIEASRLASTEPGMRVAGTWVVCLARVTYGDLMCFCHL
jgi:hypothetical protein